MSVQAGIDTMMARLFFVVLLAELVGCSPRTTLSSAVRLDSAPGVVFMARPARPVVDVTQAEFSATMIWLAADVHADAQPDSGRLLLAAWTPGIDKLVCDYQAWCVRRHEPTDCLHLLAGSDAVLGSTARRTLALAIALGSVSEGLINGLQEEILAAVATSLGAYAALVLLPEPTSKVLAGGMTVMLWAYLGSELWSVASGYLHLVDEVDEATSFVEIREAGERFGRSIGEKTARILIMVTTAAIGSTGALASKAPQLPGYLQATELAGMSGRSVTLAGVAGEARAATIAEGRLTAILGSGAVVAMISNPGAPRGYSSFKSFKRATGPAGPGKQWHHIVEQTPGNVAQFGAKSLQHMDNMIALDEGLHRRISEIYSSIRPDLTNSNVLTVRKWLSGQSFEAQREFGLTILESVRGTIP